MSNNNVDAFFELIRDDENLRKEVLAVLERSSRQTAEALSALSQGTVAPFSSEDFLEPVTVDQDPRELRDENLAGVSGGLSFEQIGGWGGALIGAGISLAGATAVGKLAKGTVSIMKVILQTAPVLVPGGGMVGKEIGRTVDHVSK